jgi:hypothetical protein
MARLDGKGIIPNGLRLNMSWQRTYKEESHGRIPVAFVSGEPDLRIAIARGDLAGFWLGA